MSTTQIGVFGPFAPARISIGETYVCVQVDSNHGGHCDMLTLYFSAASFSNGIDQTDALNFIRAWATDLMVRADEILRERELPAPASDLYPIEDLCDADD
jgi:hypothetical protein